MTFKRMFYTILQQLESIVSDLLKVKENNNLVHLCTRSIVAQCIFYYHARPVITRLYPDQKYSSEDIEQLANHISRFSLCALKGLKKQLRTAGK